MKKELLICDWCGVEDDADVEWVHFSMPSSPIFNQVGSIPSDLCPECTYRLSRLMDRMRSVRDADDPNARLVGLGFVRDAAVIFINSGLEGDI